MDAATQHLSVQRRIVDDEKSWRLHSGCSLVAASRDAATVASLAPTAAATNASYDSAGLPIMAARRCQFEQDSPNLCFQYAQVFISL